MKHLNNFFNRKWVKQIASLVLIFFVFGTIDAFAKKGFGDVTNEVRGWVDTFKTIGRYLIALGAIVGAVSVAFKMKNGEGSEGKKALASWAGGVLFAIVAWIIIENVLL